MTHFIILLILYIDLLNLSWIKKCLFLRTMEPFNCNSFFGTFILVCSLHGNVMLVWKHLERPLFHILSPTLSLLFQLRALESPRVMVWAWCICSRWGKGACKYFFCFCTVEAFSSPSSISLSSSLMFFYSFPPFLSRWHKMTHQDWCVIKQNLFAGFSGSVGCAVRLETRNVGSTPAEVSNILSWRLIVKYFLRSFSPFLWFKKGSCQFLAKECAQYWLTA